VFRRERRNRLSCFLGPGSRAIAISRPITVIHNQMEYSQDLPHPTPDAIESYALASVRDRLEMARPEVIRLEEHLLWCSPCLRSVESEEAVAMLMIDELEALKARAAKPSKSKVLHAGQISF
jgi:hypothetical protein